MTSLVNRARLAAATLAALACAGPAGAVVITYNTFLSGPAEFPPVASPGTGTASITIDDVLHTMRVQFSFSGLLGNTTAMHIHAATPVPFDMTAGVATQTPTFVGSPLGVTSGSYDMTFDMSLASSWNAAYITNNGGTPLSAEAALHAAMAEGRAYINIHTTSFMSGEIRGFLPSPGAAALFALAGAATLRRRRA